MSDRTDRVRVDRIRSRLRVLRRDLDDANTLRTELFALRLELWRSARELGVSAADLAADSEVSAITVRQLLRRGDQ